MTLIYNSAYVEEIITFLIFFAEYSTVNLQIQSLTRIICF